MHPSLLATTLLTATLMATAGRCDEAATSTRLLDVHGSKVHVEIAGDGPPLLFLHGGLQHFDNDFAIQRTVFPAFRKVIGIDRPGHGHSPDDGRPFSYRQMADDTAAIIEQLGLGPVDVVGHSDGGDIGLWLAHDHPTLVRSLVVSGANLRVALSSDEYRRRLAWTPAQLAEQTDRLAARLPASFRRDYESVTPDGPAHWPVLLAKSYLLWSNPVVIDPAMLATVAVPVLVIAGDHDFTSIEETTELFRALPHGQLLIVPASGHGTFDERAALVDFAIREFLERPIGP